MPIVVQNESQPGEMLSALKSLANDRVTEVRIGVAYTTLRGCELLLPRLKGAIGEGRWEEIKKTIVTSLDYGLTEPRALEYLAESAGFEVRIAGVDVLERSGLRPEFAFHPKLFIFNEGEQRSLLTGSANLTERALASNTEVAYLEYEVADTDAVERAWSAVLEQTEPLDAQLLEKYREKHGVERPVVEPEGAPVTVELPPVGSLTNFWDAVRTGGVDPYEYQHFWVEAGSMSSGGSYNQLEAPRGANRFFGFEFDDYEDAAVVPIGELTITRLGRTWDDRRFAWHGDNQMERINLPTRFQGGYDDYAHTAILFRRRADDFEMEVVPWNDTMSAAWQEAFRREGAIYRAGRNSTRRCGLF